MFDWVYVEHDLPDRKVEGELKFQSKSPSLPILCVGFRITNNGQLLKQGEPIDFTGGFEIHGKAGEYMCTFKDGRLQSIVPNERMRG